MANSSVIPQDSIEANTYHIIWGSSDKLRSYNLLEYFSSTDLGLLITANRLTFMVSTREEVLDLTLCSSRNGHELACVRCRICFEHMNDTTQVLRFKNTRPINWDLPSSASHDKNALSNSTKFR